MAEQLFLEVAVHEAAPLPLCQAEGQILGLHMAHISRLPLSPKIKDTHSW